MRKYYSLWQNERAAELYIYGDIVEDEWFEGDVSSGSLVKELEALEADSITVYINSYGGVVSAGLAIYNALKRHKARVKTVCDGFAGSVASVIFMAGDERVMNEASLLMVHNAWTTTAGNAGELRKQADDLDTITQASVAAYMSGVTITEDELRQLMDEETWILPDDALAWGFATGIVRDEARAASQSVKHAVAAILAKSESAAAGKEPQKENRPQKYMVALFGAGKGRENR